MQFLLNLIAEFKKIKNRILHPFCRFMHDRLKLTANILSFISFSFGAISAYFLFQNHLIFVILLSLSLFFDVLDGAMAKYEGKKGEGWIIDRGADRSVMLIILLKISLYFSTNIPVNQIIILYILINGWVFYERLFLKRENVEIIHLDGVCHILFMFQQIEAALFLKLAAMIFNFFRLLKITNFIDPKELNLPNFISIFRVFLLCAALYFFKESPIYLSFSIAVVIILDVVDGIVARKLHQESKNGPLVDIIADRAVELIALFIFAYWGLISYIFPIIFLIRGALTDFLRLLNSIYFNAHPLSLGKADSRRSRAIYATLKLITFALIPLLPQWGFFALILTTIANLQRGLPVIFSKNAKTLIKKFLRLA